MSLHCLAVLYLPTPLFLLELVGNFFGKKDLSGNIPDMYLFEAIYTLPFTPRTTNRRDSTIARRNHIFPQEIKGVGKTIYMGLSSRY